MPGIVDGVDTADARKAMISLSDKTCLNVVDFVGNAGRHKLIHPSDILGGKYSDEVVELANTTIERSGKPADIVSELAKAEREIEKRRRMREEAARRLKIRVASRYSTSKVNPFDILDIVPCREPGWHKGRAATDLQKRAIQRFGVDVPEALSFTHASQLIDRLIKRAKAGRPTFKQSKLLKRYGYDPETMTFIQAGEVITRIAANGWRRVAI